MFRTALACFLSLLLVSSLAAQEWTRFRGPNGTGESEMTGLPASWPAGPSWKTKLPGIGHSSPVLWGDRVFLISADPDNGTRYVLCLSATDGKILWKQEFAARTSAIHTQNSLASSTPAVDDKCVYAAWATPEEITLVALRHDGSSQWRVNLGPFVSQHGFGASPIVYQDMVILPNDQDGESFVVALDRGTGEIRWRAPHQSLSEQNAAYATPCLYQPAGAAPELIFCSRYHGIMAANPTSGATLWEAKLLDRRPVASPIIVDGLILANCGEGGGNNSVVAVRPPRDKNVEAEVVYKIDKSSAPYVPSLVAKGSLVFLWGDRGTVTCIDAPTGKIHWRKRVSGNYSGSPVRVGERVYCVSADGDVVTLAASETFEELGRTALGEVCRSTPAIADGRMFVHTESHLFALGSK